MKHHFVPVFYLNKWVDPNDNKVQYFKRVNGRFISGRISPKNTAFEIDLNALKLVPKEDIHKIEQFFSEKIDSPGAKVLKKLINGALESLSDQNRIDWVRFSISLRYRNPKAIENWKQQEKDHISKILLEDPEEFEAMRELDDPETLLEFANQFDPGIVKNFGIKTLVDWVYSSEIVDHISKKMSWLVLDLSNQGFSLLTSDQPCVFTSGLRDPGCFVLLPLSPTHLFIACNAGIRVGDNRKLVKDSNKLVVEQAFNYVYSQNNRQERFLKNHLKGKRQK